MACSLLLCFLLVVSTRLCIGAPLPQLRLLAPSNLFIGSAANYYAIYQNSNPADQANYTSILKSEFNLITAENCMKWAATEPQQGVFDFTQGDAMITFAKSASQTVRGHNLCWGQYNPNWLQNGNFSPSQLQALLKTYIQTVVTHYHGQVYSWDVVNEAVNDSPSPGNIFKTNIWYPAIPNYVDLAFQYAREADPTVKLFYNDYNIGGIDTKSDTVYQMVSSMKQRGIPIDGIGMEMHWNWNYYPSQAQVVSNMQRYGALGIEVHITELDVGIQGAPGNATGLQAQIYGDMLGACLKNPGVCRSFEMWGFTDAHSWRSADSADIFTTNYQPKPAFWTLAGML